MYSIQTGKYYFTRFDVIIVILEEFLASHVFVCVFRVGNIT